MSTNRDFDRIAGAWLAEGPTELSDRLLDAALDEVHLTHQRRRIAVPWRTPTLNTPLRLAAAVAIIAVVGYAGMTFLKPGVGPGALPSPTPACSPTSPAASQQGAASTPIETTSWTTYISERYGFSICHPTDWTEEPADRDWTFENDIESWSSTATESFFNLGAAPGLGVKVSAWSVAAAPGTTAESWIQAFCDATNPTPCEGLMGTVVDLETGDLAGVLSQHGDTMAAFLEGQTIYVVALWRGENDPSVKPYGGARRLLEAYVSTMRLLPGGPVEPSLSPS